MIFLSNVYRVTCKIHMTCKIFCANIVTFDVYFYRMNIDFCIALHCIVFSKVRSNQLLGKPLL